jgi:hypothetical protein
MFAAFSNLDRVELTLYTDALITHGHVRTRLHRVTDILNLSETPFLVLEDVTVTELDGSGEAVWAGFAQVNLDAVLFAVADTPVEPSPELRAPKNPEQVLVSVPPFRVTGNIHVLPSAIDLREALTELTGRFLPVTDATYSATRMGVGERQALMLAVNHRRAQILAQYGHAEAGGPGDAEGSVPQG